MQSNLQTQISKNPRTLFLIDGLGAVLSICLYVFLLAQWVNVFGMPKESIYLLTYLAVGYAVFSFLSYFKNVKRWRVFMKVIAIANVLHCVLTAGVIWQHFDKITTLGFLYFAGEFIVLIALARYEWNVASKF